MSVLRIAVVTPAVDRSAGTEKCMSWLVEDLSRRAEVTLFTSRVAQTDTARCRVHRLLAAPGPRLVRYLVFLVGSTLLIRLCRRRFDVVLATAGDCLCSDVVYAHFCCAAWSEQLRTRERTPSRATLRQRLRSLHYRTFMRVAAWVERRMYRRPGLRAVAAVSSGTAREIISYYGVAPHLVSVVPNAVDERVRLGAAEHEARRVEVRRRLGLCADDVALLFVAAGDWRRKRLMLLLGALTRLGNRRCRLLVVGDDQIPFYRGVAERLGLGDRVVFCGFQPDIEDFYAAADIFVYPSSYEAFSLVTLEAAGAGLPLVVTMTNGTDELVRSGENGLVVEPSPTAVAEALCLLADDASLRSRMGAAARAASAGFTREPVAGSLLRLCQAERKEFRPSAELAGSAAQPARSEERVCR
jgi:UDP-glucose:(heptosyl)LPS alpha-1,3-glucosyltransferase